MLCLEPQGPGGAHLVLGVCSHVCEEPVTQLLTRTPTAAITSSLDAPMAVYLSRSLRVLRDRTFSPSSTHRDRSTHAAFRTDTRTALSSFPSVPQNPDSRAALCSLRLFTYLSRPSRSYPLLVCSPTSVVRAALSRSSRRRGGRFGGAMPLTRPSRFPRIEKGLAFGHAGGRDEALAQEAE